MHADGSANGRWAAPFWFVGMEPGGDEAASNLTLWEQAGRPELSDLSIGLPGQVDWFGPTATPQMTWQKLIWLLLAYQRIEPTAAATLRYQRERLGRPEEETALIELSPFAATNTGIDVPRTVRRDERVATIAERLRTCAPEFVVFYSGNREYGKAWEAIVGQPMAEGEPVLLGPTACVITYHPNYKWGKDYWTDLGERLRAIREPVS